METKINIAEILKDKPNGIRLYSPIFGECTFCCVREATNMIAIYGVEIAVRVVIGTLAKLDSIL